MSWLYSQALVAEYLEGNCSDGARFAPSSASPTPQAYLPSDKMTAFSRPSRFGMTFAPLTDALGAELLTWFLAGFHARTSVPQERASESTANAPASGAKWRELSTRYDPVSSSWKTHRCLWEEDLPWSSVILPRSGLMRDGVCWELPTLAHHTGANDAGFGQNWPTPDARDAQPEGLEAGIRRMEKYSTCGLQTAVKLWPTPTCPNGGRSVAHVTDWRSDRTAYTANGKKVQVDLAQAVKRWATPTVCGNNNRAGASLKSGDGLATQAGGALNPTWVEWLMGWPLGWTDLKPLETDRCRSALQRRGAA